MNTVFKLTALLLALSLVSCAAKEQMNETLSANDEMTYQVSFLNVNDKVLFQAKGESNVKKVELLLKDKRVMMKKILPVFDSKIIIESGDSREEWLFVKPNYLKLNSKQDKTIYELNGKVDLLNALKNMR